MLRMGRNQKGDQAPGETPADQTPQPAPHYGSPAQPTAPHTTASSSTAGSGNTDGRFQSSGQPATRAVTESESLARDIKEGTLSGFVGNGTTLTGEANFKGMLRVDGHLSGRISSEGGTLIISTGGQVDANIEVAVATINGTVNGDIIASKRIELGRVAKVTGNIQTPALVIEQGAVFEGNCRMVHLKEAQDRRREEETRAATSSSGSSPSGSATKSEPVKPATETPAGATAERAGARPPDAQQKSPAAT